MSQPAQLVWRAHVNAGSGVTSGSRFRQRVENIPGLVFDLRSSVPLSLTTSLDVGFPFALGRFVGDEVLVSTRSSKHHDVIAALSQQHNINNAKRAEYDANQM